AKTNASAKGKGQEKEKGEWGMGNGERKSIPAPGARCNWAVLPMADSICWGADALRDLRP
ncbi:hypothetical protein L2223_20910, partial [Xanthomonas perforans]|uniref:hypothetical protein n=1 Tax=Xanthomonas perforans TaxID=442694 RepID=UPI001F3B3B75